MPGSWAKTAISASRRRSLAARYRARSSVSIPCPSKSFAIEWPCDRQSRRLDGGTSSHRGKNANDTNAVLLRLLGQLGGTDTSHDVGKRCGLVDGSGSTPSDGISGVDAKYSDHIDGSGDCCRSSSVLCCGYNQVAQALSQHQLSVLFIAMDAPQMPLRLLLPLSARAGCRVVRLRRMLATLGSDVLALYSSDAKHRPDSASTLSAGDEHLKQCVDDIFDAAMKVALPPFSLPGCGSVC